MEIDRRNASKIDSEKKVPTSSAENDQKEQGHEEPGFIKKGYDAPPKLYPKRNEDRTSK